MNKMLKSGVTIVTPSKRKQKTKIKRDKRDISYWYNPPGGYTNYWTIVPISRLIIPIIRLVIKNNSEVNEINMDKKTRRDWKSATLMGNFDTPVTQKPSDSSSRNMNTKEENW